MTAVTAIRARRSIGLRRYCDALALALEERGYHYEIMERPKRRQLNHWHLANSSRRLAWDRSARDTPLVLTVHDVLPRTAFLMPAYRRFVYPRALPAATRVVTHSRYAADLLMRTAALDARRIEIIPHGTTVRASDRSAARRTLGLPIGDRLAVLPGVSKTTKLVREAITAVAESCSEWTLVVAGHGALAAVNAAGAPSGVIALESPSDGDYDAAIAAADAVLVLRSDSVGETNGPLLDALGAGRAVIATKTGSIPELAGEAALYAAPDARSLREALRQLADADERTQRERLAAQQAGSYAWPLVAEAHADLFDEVLRV